MKLFGSNELFEDVIQKDICIGCGACTELCPYFQNYFGKTARIFPCDRKEGRCFAYCPKTEVDLDALSVRFHQKNCTGEALGNYSEILSSKAGKKVSAGVFQGGGTVSALMAFALENGIIDAAVLTDQENGIPAPRLVTDAGEVIRCAGSKYMAAPTLSAFNRGVKEGFRRMGVVGTPCQMTALAQIRTNPLEMPDFADPVGVAVGLFCTWALDTRRFAAFLSGRVEKEKIRTMDVPPPPAEIMIIESETKRLEIPLSEIRPMIPQTCGICPDMTAEWADLSVGAVEGRPGWNTLIIRTERGKEIVEKACREGWLITEAMPEEHLENLRRAAANKKRRAIRLAAEKGLVNTGEEGKRAAIRMPEAVFQKMMEKETACQQSQNLH
ncbi:MAG: Coenzyme F420 hydrogenase/dehydrogenase, beta subunit C-terminal domain [Desulfobacterales bacterium]